jgi:GDP-mannose 6-dehydrogenase
MREVSLIPPRAPFLPTTSVAVAGLGYVGCVTAACLAHLGHRVTGVDRDAHKVTAVREGWAPFHEPGLEELLLEGHRTGRLAATQAMDEALAASEIVLLCVGTPSEPNGNMSLEQLSRVSSEIGALLPRRSRRLIVAVRSTVFPGTCQDVVAAALGGSPLATVVSNPEFMREGVAVRDFLEPSLLVVGGDDPEAVRQVAALYAGLPIEPCLVSLGTAEMIKYACNAFHALKIAFANEMGTLAACVGAQPGQVMETLCRDTKLNLSAAYLRPGFAFGGSCLPKDLRALVYRAGRLDLKLPLTESVGPSNEQHLRRAIMAAQSLTSARLGVYGLAFKENTDDLRESPVVALIEQLLAKGRSVRVFDPHIRLDRIYGSNLNYVLTALPHIGNLLKNDLDEMLAECDHLILTQKPPAGDQSRIGESHLPILDLTQIVG